MLPSTLPSSVGKPQRLGPPGKRGSLKACVLSRRQGFAAVAVISFTAGNVAHEAKGADFAAEGPLAILDRTGSFALSDEEWRKRLSRGQYSVLRKAGTELPFGSPLNNEKRTGTFNCAGCGAPLFASQTKYNSGTGWPSFYQALPGAVTELPDLSIIFMPRTEVRCARCQGHIGHVFEDGPEPTGLRYCMNGVALTFEPSSA